MAWTPPIRVNSNLSTGQQLVFAGEDFGRFNDGKGLMEARHSHFEKETIRFVDTGGVVRTDCGEACARRLDGQVPSSSLLYMAAACCCRVVAMMEVGMEDESKGASKGKRP